MARIELGPIPTEGLTDEEIEEIREKRISKIVNDIGGETRNADLKNHPFNEYYRCNTICSSGDGKMLRCGFLMTSFTDAISHEEKHRKIYLEKGYNVQVSEI